MAGVEVAWIMIASEAGNDSIRVRSSWARRGFIRVQLGMGKRTMSLKIWSERKQVNLMFDRICVERQWYPFVMRGGESPFEALVLPRVSNA